MLNKKVRKESLDNWFLNTIHWRDGDTGTVRVWKHNWLGDQFEILTLDEWKEVQKTFDRFNIRMQKHEDDEE